MNEYAYLLLIVDVRPMPQGRLVNAQDLQSWRRCSVGIYGSEFITLPGYCRSVCLWQQVGDSHAECEAAIRKMIDAPEPNAFSWVKPLMDHSHVT